MSIPGQVAFNNNEDSDFLAGKTIVKNARRNDEAVIIFSDDTFVLLGVELDDLNSPPRITNKRATLDDHGQELVSLGLYTQQQLDNALQQRDADEAAETEARRFALYQKLKQIYDP